MSVSCRKKVNWGMLLSHHPPCQYNRTVRIGSVRFCVRCSAIFSAMIGAFFWDYISIQDPLYALPLLFFLPIPAVGNFVLTEMKIIRNSNFWRFLTGILLGYGLGCSLNYFSSPFWEWGVLLISWIFLLEFVVVVILNRAGVLDAYIKEYEDGLYR